MSELIFEVIMQGWEETIVKEEQGESELKISLPSLPSLYIISFLCRASEEIHRIGGHVLDKSILQKFASSLLEKVRCLVSVYLLSCDYFLHAAEVFLARNNVLLKIFVIVIPFFTLVPFHQ